MAHPRLPKHVRHALSAPYPPPYTPHWRSTLPLLKLPPTTSSYLFPLKTRFTFLPVSPRIIAPAYSIYHIPSPPAQDVLSLPLDVRYWPVRQKYEERGKKSERIAAMSPGGGGGLWWNVNPFVKNTKSVARSRLARKMRSAFRDALSEGGFNQDGLRIEKSSQNSSMVGNNARKENRSLVLGNLIGTLRINATAQALDASHADLHNIFTQVVDHLQAIRLHHQRGTVGNMSGRHNSIHEQTWQEAKADSLRAMERMQAQIDRMNSMRKTEFPMMSDVPEPVLFASEGDTRGSYDTLQ